MVQAYQHLWLAQRDDVYQRFASANHAIQPWRPNRLDAGSNNLASRSGRRPLGRGLVVPGASHGPIAQAARPSRVLEVELQVGSRPSAPTATYLTSCRTSPALRASVSPDSLRVHCAPPSIQLDALNPVQRAILVASPPPSDRLSSAAEPSLALAWAVQGPRPGLCGMRPGVCLGIGRRLPLAPHGR